MPPRVQLTRSRPADRQRLLDWLSDKEVARWFVTEDLLRSFDDPPTDGGHFIIQAAGAASGFLRFRRVPASTLAALGLSDLPEGAMDIDILLAPERQGRGIGVAALEAFCNRNELAHVPLFALSSDPRNGRAHRCFERAGFRRDRQYRDPDGHRLELFLRGNPQHR